MKSRNYYENVNTHFALKSDYSLYIWDSIYIILFLKNINAYYSTDYLRKVPSSL